MKILFINPNSTASMTALIAHEASAVASPRTDVLAREPAGSPAAIQGPLDGEAAVPHVIAELDAALASERVDAVVVACFDDTGLEVLRERFAVPIFGIGECAFQLAMLRARRFCVVTTLEVSVPVIRDNIARYGFESRCADVYAAGVGVLEIDADPVVSFDRICACVEQARDEHRCDAIVLGCAGMANIATQLEVRYNMPVIDGVKAAVLLAEAVVKSTQSVPPDA